MKTHLHVLRFALVSAGLVLALQACSGGSPPVTPPVTAIIGAAGGTLSTSSGAKVVIPPGALSGDITIGIEQTGVGAPPLPGGFTTVGQMFAFTPHGQNFAAPVTITLPFNPASVPAGGTPELYKNNAQNQWEPVVGATFGSSSVSGVVTSFSFPVVVVPALVSSDPLRVWKFFAYPGDGSPPVEVPGGDTLIVGMVDVIGDFGAAAFDEPIIAATETLPTDGRANGHVYSSANGKSYSVLAEAPTGGVGSSNPVGSKTSLKQFQSFVKLTEAASLSFTLTDVRLEVADFNTRDAPTQLIRSEVLLSVGAYKFPREYFYYAGAKASVRGREALFVPNAQDESFSRTPVWTIDDFDFTTTDITFPPTDIGATCIGGGRLATLELKKPRKYVIDLSSIKINEVFTVRIDTYAETDNRRSGPKGDCESSYARAYLRDPLEIGGGALEFSGLEPSNQLLPEPALRPLIEPAACVPGPGPNPAAGVLQFDAAAYTIDELPQAAQTVMITRTGGSTGAVTATFATSDGTAVAGTDYTAQRATVFFADGDTGQRLVSVPIIPNTTSREPDKTVNITLSQPGGCAALGAQTSTVLTIKDDDVFIPPTFSVGGTVTGLVGTGLVLQDLKFLPITPTNGAFTFPAPTTTGLQYAVTIVSQPTNPLQTCSVTNGAGTISNANITNIVVNCVTPVVNGALDSSFGDGGKTFTAFGGDESALALQADGKVVMVGGSVTDFSLARYTTTGRLDAGFGSAGLVTTDIATAADQARGVAIQSDGKIVVVGSAVVGRTANNISNFDFAVARYLPDGTPDNSFSGDGKVTTDFNLLADQANAVAIQSDGKIVVVGSATLTNPGFADFAIARYDTNGTLDSSFDGDGKVTTAVGARVDLARNVVVLADQTILVSGFSEVNSRDGTSSGALDTSFGGGSGKTSVPEHRLEDGLSVQSDGKIVIAGSVNVGVFPARSSHFGVMRFSANGSPDNGFGTAGLVTLAFTALNDFGRAIALQADGKIVVAGQSSNGSNPDFGIARFNTDGTPDGSFGTGGKLSFSFFNAGDGAEGVVIQPDGKIVVGGFVTSGTQFGYGLARVNP
jgi:uncharacterized delta-60 repeat protein